MQRRPVYEEGQRTDKIYKEVGHKAGQSFQRSQANGCSKLIILEEYCDKGFGREFCK